MLALVTSCGKCSAPIRKAFSARAYEEGVVLITCGGCGVRHLVADHLGWMGDQPGGDAVARSRVDLSTLYGDRLQRGTLEPAVRADGSIGAEVRRALDEGLVEGLSAEEAQELFHKATHRKQ
jgi:hypothetical protein